MRRFALLLALLFAATFAAGGAAAKPYEFYGCTFHDGKDMDDLDAWFGGWPHDRSREAWSKRRYPDDTWEIEYAYEGGAGEDPVYLQSGLTVEGSARDARFGYAALEAASRAGLSMFGGDELTIIERPDLLSWGDDSVCWLIEGPAGPVGNFFLARKDKRLLHYYGVGFYFDEPGLMQEFLAGPLAVAESHALAGQPVRP